jgi:hypothetical protein
MPRRRWPDDADRHRAVEEERHDCAAGTTGIPRPLRCAHRPEVLAAALSASPEAPALIDERHLCVYVYVRTAFREAPAVANDNPLLTRGPAKLPDRHKRRSSGAAGYGRPASADR